MNIGVYCLYEWFLYVEQELMNIHDEYDAIKLVLFMYRINSAICPPLQNTALVQVFRHHRWPKTNN